MNNIKVILISILFHAVTVNGACSYDYDTTNLCYIVYVTCNERFNLAYDLNILLYSQVDFSSQCKNENIYIRHIYDYNGNYYHQIYLTFKTTQINLFNEQIYPVPYNVKDLITTLDISNNGYQEMPTGIFSLPNLKHLIVSQNSIKRVILSSTFFPTSLIELDLSNNVIDVLESLNSETNFGKLTKLNLSHNYLVIIADSVFQPFSVLTYLDLSHNFIEVLNSLTFDGVEGLHYLNVSNNRLFDINESLLKLSQLQELDFSHNHLQTIKEVDFRNITEIVKLNLQHNEIKTIEKLSFKNLQQLEEIDLSFNVVEFIDNELFKNTGNLKKVDLKNNNIYKFSKDCFENNHLSSFSLENNRLNGSLLTGMFEGLDLVKTLDLSNQNLTGVEDYAFLGLKDVESILLNNNHINLLTPNSFRRLKNLNLLDLSNNSITEIDFAKEDLTNLQYLYLKSNQLNCVEKKQFLNLNELLILDLSFNNIVNIEKFSFKNLSNLVKIVISNNPISSELQENTFDGLHSLQSLDISFTHLSVLKNSSFNGLSQISNINISHCQITEVQFNAFDGTNNIKIVDLSWNQLEHFLINFSHFNNLRELNLERNYLKQIEFTTYNNIPLLHKLYLLNNNLSQLSSDSLVPLKNLVTLTLSGIDSFSMSFNKTSNMLITKLIITQSNINNVSVLSLNNLQRLETLFMNNDNITSLSTTDFRSVKNLYMLDLSFNKITYIQPGTFKDNAMLSTLNISHNSLSNIGYGVFHGLTNIDTIDLSHNSLMSLQSENFHDVKNLRFLIADHNKITQINIVRFADTHLSQLSIGDNPLSCDVLVQLRDQSPFSITAVYEDSNKENVGGITCNIQNHIPTNTSLDINKNEDDQILKDIRNILLNISAKNDSNPSDTLADVDKNENILIMNDIKNILSNISTKLDLNKSSIIDTKVTATPNYEPEKNLTKTIMQYNNITKNFLVSFKKLLEENSNNTNIFKQNMKNNNTLFINPPSVTPKNRSSFEEYLKDTLVNHQIDLEQQVKLLSAKFEQQQTSKPDSVSLYTEGHFIFLEICMVLILLFLVGFTFYKTYKSRVYSLNRRSISTRPITESEANSEL